MASKPNILVIFGDDIGQSQVSAYSMGVMGYRTPNIDRIAQEGAIFTDAYGQQSCTAAAMNEVNSGCGSSGLDFSSGWNCTPMNQGWSGISMISGSLPSGDQPDTSMPCLARSLA